VIVAQLKMRKFKPKTIKLVIAASPLSMHSIKEQKQRLLAGNQNNVYK
jgi:hypothetical protein